MCVCLEGARDWVTANQLLAHMGLAVTESSRRRLRRAAEESEGRIGGGQRGYKLVELMTTEEWLEFKHWMRGQAISMMRRCKQAAHRRRTGQLEFGVPVRTGARASAPLPANLENE